MISYCYIWNILVTLYDIDYIKFQFLWDTYCYLYNIESINEESHNRTIISKLKLFLYFMNVSLHDLHSTTIIVLILNTTSQLF